MMTSTHNATATPPPVTPTPDALETVNVERIHRLSPWPLFAALTLAAVAGPATGWLLLVAPLTTTQMFIVAAAVPAGTGLLAIASTLLNRETHQ